MKMAHKRSADELNVQTVNSNNINAKRVRMSPTVDSRSNSSIPSTGFGSEDALLHSSPHALASTRQSSVSSLQTSSFPGRESNASSSSEESSDLESDEEEIITVGGPRKPRIGDNGGLDGASDLQARLASLLPQLLVANRELEHGAHGRSMEDVEDGEQHIEMDLGLGVLEEQEEGDADSEDESSENDDDDDDDDARPLDEGDATASPSNAVRDRNGRDNNVMRQLLGQRKDRRQPGIEDLG